MDRPLDVLGHSVAFRPVREVKGACQEIAGSSIVLAGFFRFHLSGVANGILPQPTSDLVVSADVVGLGLRFPSRDY